MNQKSLRPLAKSTKDEKAYFCQNISRLDPFCRGVLFKNQHRVLDPDLVKKVENISFWQRKLQALVDGQGREIFSKEQEKEALKLLELSNTFLNLITRVEIGEVDTASFVLMANYTHQKQQNFLGFKQEQGGGFFRQKLTKLLKILA